MGVSETYSTIIREIVSSGWFTPTPSLVSRCIESVQIHWPQYDVNLPETALVAHMECWWMNDDPFQENIRFNIQQMLDTWRAVVGHLPVSFIF